MNSSTSTATLAGNLADFAEPPANLMDAPALDYFFIEMVNTLRDSSAVAISRTKKIEQEMAEAAAKPSELSRNVKYNCDANLALSRGSPIRPAHSHVEGPGARANRCPSEWYVPYLWLFGIQPLTLRRRLEE